MAEKNVEKKEFNKEEEIIEKKMEEDQEFQDDISSLDLLWKHVFNELDEWAKRANFRDEVLLREATLFAESVERNQENLKGAAEKFNKELSEWERTAREEFLMTTTTLQHFFPIRSYEEINQQIDQIYKRTISILSKPCQKVSDYQPMEKYLEVIDQYIAIRKKGRLQYINAVKQAGNLIYENQRGLMNLFTRQIKNFMFPLSKYMEKTEELTKS